MTGIVRNGTIPGIAAGLGAVIDLVVAEPEGAGIQNLGWRAQQAHLPPSAWVNFLPSTAKREGQATQIDELRWQLWFTANPSSDENSELVALATLAEKATRIVDVALRGSRALFGVDVAYRSGLQFTRAKHAEGAGHPVDVPALLIPVAVTWRASVC